MVFFFFFFLAMVLSAACFKESGAICPVPEAGGLGAL